ncbi:MAG: hypothetical protein ACYTE8_05025, partial [Planctomycetota bacterium]
TGGWPDVSEEQIGQVLSLLKGKTEGVPVYIAGGQLYQLNSDGKLSSSQHQAASPYLWPIAHNVRPAAQSLGVNRCGDCHSTDSPFVFGMVHIDSPIISQQPSFKKMIEFQHLDSLYFIHETFCIHICIPPMAENHYSCCGICNSCSHSPLCIKSCSYHNKKISR